MPLDHETRFDLIEQEVAALRQALRTAEHNLGVARFLIAKLKGWVVALAGFGTGVAIFGIAIQRASSLWDWIGIAVLVAFAVVTMRMEGKAWTMSEHFEDQRPPSAR